MKTTLKYLLIVVPLLIYSTAPAKVFQQEELTVKLSGKRATIYNHLNTLSEQTGYMFIYDSRIIENDRVVRVPSGDYTVKRAVEIITGNSGLETKKIGNHILISLIAAKDSGVTGQRAKAVSAGDSVVPYFTIEGVIRDRIGGEPVQYASVTISGYNIGTVTNLDGNFKLTLHDSLRNSYIKISHLGYVTREISVDLLSGKKALVQLDQKLIPLQEVVIRVVDPVKTIREAMFRRVENYSREAVNQLAFYREGVEYRDNLMHTEALFKIYKTGYLSSVSNEQVKMLKMRKFTSNDFKDTLVAKIKSSVYSSLLLDIIKNPPDFLSPESFTLYNYSHTDVTVIDDKRVLVISFSQKEHITEPLYEGDIYVDATSLAIIRANFRINTLYVNKTSDIFVVKKSRDVEISPRNIEYMVSYRPHNGVYYVHHIRGDLNFKVRRAKKLFSSNLHAWFEMVMCETSTDNVTQIPRNERLPVRDILFETNYSYDEDFWEHFNTILPEEEITKIIRKFNLNN